MADFNDVISPFNLFDENTARALANGRERMQRGACGCDPDPLERFWKDLVHELRSDDTRSRESARATFEAFVKGPRHFLPISIVEELFRMRENDIVEQYFQAHPDLYPDKMN